MHPAEHGRHRVTEQRDRRRRTRHAEPGPVAVGPRGVQVQGAQKGDGQDRLRGEQLAKDRDHCSDGISCRRRRRRVCEACRGKNDARTRNRFSRVLLRR